MLFSMMTFDGLLSYRSNKPECHREADFTLSAPVLQPYIGRHEQAEILDQGCRSATHIVRVSCIKAEVLR